MTPEMLKRKILLLGDGAVGKTSLIRRFVIDTFSDDYITTIGSKVTKKEVMFKIGFRDVEVTLLIWDVLGQRGFRHIQDGVFQGARGIVLVLDLTRPDTGKGLIDYWVPKAQALAPSTPMILFGNKVDLILNRKVEDEKAKQIAANFDCNYHLTSAKTGENVEKGFRALARLLIDTGEVDSKVTTVKSEYGVAGDMVSVTDMIMIDFCNDFGGVESGTPVLKEQFNRAGLDINSPTLNSLLKAVDLLAGVEKSFKSFEDVEKTRNKRLGWIREIKKS